MANLSTNTCGVKSIVQPVASDTFVTTPYVNDITERSLVYLNAGFPVHFAGLAGTGKTTFAFHVAALRGRPVTLIHGNNEFNCSDLIGRESGYRRSKVVDNYIHSVLKTHEEMKSLWVDSYLTTACKEGHTLVYDEYNRSTPETNNVLLSVLAEGILNSPEVGKVFGAGYLGVHPEFRVIFTSNPEEYAGTHKTQDALIDRMISIRLDFPDRETEINIVTSRSGINRKDGEKIVDIVREMRSADCSSGPAVRAAIAISKIIKSCGGVTEYGNKFFHNVCYDIFSMETAKLLKSGQSVLKDMIDNVIKKVCKEKKV